VTIIDRVSESAGLGHRDLAGCRQSVLTLGIRVFGAGAALLFNVIVARLLGASDTGVFFLCIAIIVVAGTVCRAGLDTAATKIIGREFAQNNWSAVRGLFRGSVALGFIFAVPAALLLYAFAPFLADSLFGNQELTDPLRLLAPAIPLLTVLNIGAACFFGIQKPGMAFALQNTMVPLFATFGLLVPIGEHDVAVVSLVYVSSALLSCVLGGAGWRRHTRNFAATATFSRMREMLSLAPAMLAAAIMNRVVMRWSAVIFLGIWSTTTEVGMFAVTARLTLVLGFALTVANSIAAPRLSSQFADGNLLALKSTVASAAIFALSISAPMFMLFFLLPNWTMSLFGDEFRQAGSLLLILSAGELINVVTGPVGVLLQMSKYERAYKNCTFAGGAIQIGLCLILIPKFGAIGAAIATAVSMSATNFFAAAVSYKKLGIIPVPFMAGSRLVDRR